ncbi:hypothetical protein ACIGBH_38820 [Streptomyces sp. NPDC085929]|uniref:hypothetical protein n=1 Tax=Streptomyces sp. NPDC085929 TaxID=3365739 RepID=UPI0037D36DC8
MTTARQQHARTTRGRRLLAATAIAATVAAVTTGCSKDDNKAAPPSPTMSASPSVSSSASEDPLKADKAEVQAAYDRYWSVLTAAYAKADSQGTGLNGIATGSAYAQTEGDLASLRKAGQITVGNPQHSTTSISFKEGQKLKTAVLTDCVDISQWKPVDKKTGKEISLPPERRLRYVTTLTAEKWPNGWMFLEEKLQDQAC